MRQQPNDKYYKNISNIQTSKIIKKKLTTLVFILGKIKKNIKKHNITNKTKQQSKTKTEQNYIKWWKCKKNHFTAFHNQHKLCFLNIEWKVLTNKMIEAIRTSLKFICRTKWWTWSTCIGQLRFPNGGKWRSITRNN